MPGKPFRLRDEFLSRVELACQLNRTVRCLQRWERNHLGPNVTHIGKSSYYSAKAVRAWLADQEKKQAPEVVPALHDAG